MGRTRAKVATGRRPNGEATGRKWIGLLYEEFAKGQKQRGRPDDPTKIAGRLDETVRQLPRLDGSSAGQQYIGRQVLSGSVAYIASQWWERAAALDLNLIPLRPPIGIRYLGYLTLQRFKACARGNEESLNPELRHIAKFSEITEAALDDSAGPVAETAGTQWKGHGVMLNVRQYVQWPEGCSTIFGLSLSDSLEDKVPRAIALGRELDFMHRYFDADAATRPTTKRVYVPVGRVDTEEPDNPRLLSLIKACELERSIQVTLGEITSAEEPDWQT
jgi:hypothetical protein